MMQIALQTFTMEMFWALTAKPWEPTFCLISLAREEGVSIFLYIYEKCMVK